MHADDGFDRARQRVETQYFHCATPCALDVPAGQVTIGVQHGFAHLPWASNVELAAGESRKVMVELKSNALPAAFGSWMSADLHVHTNYGGHYRNSTQNVLRQAAAEDLDVIYNLIVNKEERIPDIARFRPGADPASDNVRLLMQAQEYHTSFWGHLGLLNLSDHLLLPDFSSYRHTALASPYPHNGVIADLAHAQGALVGYVHPFDFEIDPAKEKSLTYQLPADVAHGKVDYLEVVGFSDHRVTAAVWYRLLNLGFRVAAGAGTDAMANYASLRGPVGLTRVFVDTGGRRTPEAVRDSIKAGRSFVSNGPLLGLEMAGERPGATISRSAPGRARIPGGAPLARRRRPPRAGVQRTGGAQTSRSRATGARSTPKASCRSTPAAGSCFAPGTMRRIRWCSISIHMRRQARSISSCRRGGPPRPGMRRISRPGSSG